ncbi:MAG: DUF416 family protein [Succinivibrio sp.]
MIFGEKFYELLSKMSPWRQSLFALTLAQRMYPNYALWCDVNEVNGGKKAFKSMLDTMWEFHTDKFNHIDLEKEAQKLEPFVVSEDKSDDMLSIGDWFSLDASIALLASANAVTEKTGEEAKMASMTSLGGVVRKIEQESDEEYDDETLREMPLVDGEVNFQVAVYELISKSSRGEDLVRKLYRLGLNDGISNIGLALDK